VKTAAQHDAAHPLSSQRLHAGTPSLDDAANAAEEKEGRMLKWAIIFAIVSLVTGWLGFYSVSGVTGTIAKALFAIFLILFLIAVLAAIGLFHIV
jgi:uncharacterized membrane protein YtjA (UPF0391 family)